MKKSRTSLVFFMVAFYIFASYLWWAFLLIQKNDLLLEQTLLNYQLEYNIANDLPKGDKSYLTTADYGEMIKKHESQKWMVFGEGFVFLFLILAGTMQLYRSFSREMALARQQNNFLLSITHELKSPLASIRLSIQTLLMRLNLEDKFQRLLNNSLDDTDRLAALVDNILFAAKMENSTYSFSLESVNLSDLVEKQAARIQQLAKDTHNISTDIQPNVMVKADKIAMSSAIINLLENAVKYSPESTTIAVKLNTKGKQSLLQIADQGPGVQEGEKLNIFDKFYRVGNEETRSAKGTGLGLFIVKSVSEGHLGKVYVSDNEPVGSIFTILLPLDISVVQPQNQQFETESTVS